jgi:1-acyl-sn-glycerol-3-phosphate acyltransferase
VYPEGTFVRAPGLRPFKLGAFHVAAQSGAPLVPVAIRGMRSILRDGQWVPRRGTVVLSFGEPLAPDGNDFAASVRLRDRARAVILERCGEPDLVDAAAP